MWLGWIPVGATMVRLAGRSPDDAGLAVGFGLAYLLSALVVGLLFQFWPCPRCRQSFASRAQFGWHSPWPTRCAHCGLPVGAPDLSAPPA